jgi:hypothetical protein
MLGGDRSAGAAGPRRDVIVEARRGTPDHTPRSASALGSAPEMLRAMSVHPILPDALTGAVTVELAA